MRKLYRAERNSGQPTGKEGMITVEVSVIVPVFLFIIAAAICFLLFLLDMSLVIGQSQKEAVRRAELYLLPEKERQAAETLPPRISGSLTAGKACRVTADKGNHLVKVTAVIHTSIPLSGARRYSGMGAFSYCYTAFSASADQEEMVREACRIFLEKR